MSEEEWVYRSRLSCSSHLVLKSLPSRISLAIDMKLKEVEKVLYFESFIVVEPGLTTLKGQLISEEALLKAQEEFGEDALLLVLELKR